MCAFQEKPHILQNHTFKITLENNGPHKKTSWSQLAFVSNIKIKFSALNLGAQAFPFKK